MQVNDAQTTMTVCVSLTCTLSRRGRYKSGWPIGWELSEYFLVNEHETPYIVVIFPIKTAEGSID